MSAPLPDWQRFIAGNPFPAHADAAYPRAPLELPVSRLPRDTWAAACIPAAVRLEFEGRAAALRVLYRCRASAPDNAGQLQLTRHMRADMAACFELWSAQQCLASMPAGVDTGLQSVTIPLSGDGPYTLYLPELLLPEIVELRVIDGELRPRPARPRWLAYGDSITEGWCASSAALSWSARCARALDLDLINFGYSGAARGEIAAAEMLAGQRADVISVAFGTNCWSRVAHDGALFGATLRTFLQIVRAAHPTLPIFALSPILRPDGEQRANARGLTHAQLRAVFEQTVFALQEQGDTQLHLIEGLPLLNRDDLSADGIHPNDAGHAAIAQVFAQRLRPWLSPLSNRGA